jgi:hypothetical protein
MPRDGATIFSDLIGKLDDVMRDGCHEYRVSAESFEGCARLARP